MVAQQGVQPRIAGFGNDLAVPVGIELVDHHPIVANQFAETLGHSVHQHYTNEGVLVILVKDLTAKGVASRLAES